VEAGLWRERGWDLSATVVGAGYAFAKVVGLNETRGGGAEVRS
jgi:hypothetical protein